MSIITASIHCGLGGPTQFSKTRRKNQRYMDWKGKIKLTFRS